MDFEQHGRRATSSQAERRFDIQRARRQAEIDELRAKSGRPPRPEPEPEAPFTKKEIENARRSRKAFEARQDREADYDRRREDSDRSVRRMMGIRPF